MNKRKHKKVEKRRKKYIVVCGMVMQKPQCDECNYCECETCPTWHGKLMEDETDD